jgi:hypothetical protein
VRAQLPNVPDSSAAVPITRLACAGATMLLLMCCSAKGPVAPVGSSAEPTLVSSGATHEERTPSATRETLGLCKVSVDKTYGYTLQNAIKVGGDAIVGPQRQIEYLRLLRGPAGEAVTFRRRGTASAGDLMIDVYEVTYHGVPEPIVLYLDEYSWSPPMIPTGLSCSGPVSLEAP